MPDPAPGGTVVRPAASKVLPWVGRVLAVPPVGLLLFSAYMKLSKNPQAVDGFKQAGYGEGVVTTIGVVEVACTLLYLIPRTSMLGAILLAGYLGGAVNHHVRAGEGWYAAAGVGVVLWLSLLLREPRLRVLLPWRRP